MPLNSKNNIIGINVESESHILETIEQHISHEKYIHLTLKWNYKIYSDKCTNTNIRMLLLKYIYIRDIQTKKMFHEILK